MSPEVFYLQIDGEQRGPYTVAQIDHLLNSGLIKEDAQFWREGLEDFQPVTNLVALRAKPATRWVRRAFIAAFIVVGLLLARLFGPVTLEGWREASQYDQFSPQAAYWRARDYARREGVPAGAVVSFGGLKTAKIQLINEPKGAKVWLPAEVSQQGTERPAAWDIELRYDAEEKQWTGVSIQSALR